MGNHACKVHARDIGKAMRDGGLDRWECKVGMKMDGEISLCKWV